MSLIKIDKPVIVEGKYDKIKLESVIDAKIITTDGFGIFKSDEKISLIRRLAEKCGVIILTDSDGAGLVIRNYFNSVLPGNKITHLYIPEKAGKEKRKISPSKAGLLGVEGIDAELLREIFKPFENNNINLTKSGRKITKNDFYSDGLSGRDNSTVLRDTLCFKLGLPSKMSANSLLTALNLLYTYEQYTEFINGENDEIDKNSL